MAASDRLLALARFASGFVSGMVVGAVIARGSLFILNPVWLGDLLWPFVYRAACVGGLVCALWAFRSSSASRILGAVAIASCPILLLALWGRTMWRAFGFEPVPMWWWGVPALVFASGWLGIVAARRTPGRRALALSRKNQVDLSWIIGHAFRQLSRREHDWLFTFSEGVSLVAYCSWRLLAGGRIQVSSDDDGQQFGLPEPIDSATEATKMIDGRLVRSISVRPGVLDLLIEFDGGHALEVLPVSAGYEAWQVDRPADRSSVIAIGGGELARFVRPDSGDRWIAPL